MDLTIADGLYIPTDEKGVAGGVATLDSSGKVPEEQLPETFSIDDIASQPGVTVTEEEVVGESGFSTWTTIITKESAELARQVDVESEENGKAVWTTTITIGDKTVQYLQKETEKGWVTTVS